MVRKLGYVLAWLLFSGAAAASTPDVVAADAPDPSWLAPALEAAREGMESYWGAEFDEAAARFVEALGVLTERFDEHPVGIAIIETTSVYLILSLHALGKEQEAGEVAAGLGALLLPPWGADLDLAPASREYLAGLSEGLPPLETGNIGVAAPEDCTVLVDGEEVGEGVVSGMDVAEGTHWVQIRCGSLAGDHRRIVVERGGTVGIEMPDPGHEVPGQDVQPPPDPAGKEDLLADLKVEKRPWFGDGWNLALECSGVLLLGLGAGLLGGSLRIESRARTIFSLRYSSLERTALEMEVAGWVLLGAGAVALTLGVIRMAMTGGDE